jgi:hypothetical protein
VLLLLQQRKVVDFGSLNSVQLPVFERVFQCGLSACCVVKLAADLDTGLMSAVPGSNSVLRKIFGPVMAMVGLSVECAIANFFLEQVFGA